MVDIKKLDTYFNADSEIPAARPDKKQVNRHTRIVRFAKLFLPSLAAILVGLLLLFPTIHKDVRDFKLDITRPKKGELEKLHVEDTVFYITDEGIIPLENGEWNTVKAPLGFFNQKNNLLRLDDDVEMFYSAGMAVHTTEAFFDFPNSKGYGSKPVSAQGVFGNLKAEGFEFSTADDILVFTGHSDITIKER